MDNAEKAAIYRLHADFCKTLSDANRLLIINELAKGEVSVNELTRRLELKQSNFPGGWLPDPVPAVSPDAWKRSIVLIPIAALIHLRRPHI